MDEFYRALCRAAGEEQVKRQESMALHTTFRTGGPAAFFASVKTEEELRQTVGGNTRFPIICWAMEAICWWEAQAFQG